MKTSLRNRIIKYFEKHYGEWKNGGELERIAFENGYKASNCSRRLRELAEEGILEREEKSIAPSKVSTVWYRLNCGKIGVNEETNFSPIKKETMESIFSLYKNKGQGDLFHLRS